jgi:formylmethanofuran dehydrogenase subunit E
MSQHRIRLLGNDKFEIAGVPVEVHSADEIAELGCPLVCLEVAVSAEVVEGGLKTICSNCGALVWLSPSSKEVQRKGRNPVICWGCFTQQEEKVNKHRI